MGAFMHAVEGEMLCSSTDVKHVPYFNAPILYVTMVKVHFTILTRPYSLENKSQIGKVDEILGPINEVHFTIKMDAGMVATSFKKDDKVYISSDKLLPIERFLPKPKALTKGRYDRSERHTGLIMSIQDRSPSAAAAALREEEGHEVAAVVLEAVVEVVSVALLEEAQASEGAAVEAVEVPHEADSGAEVATSVAVTIRCVSVHCNFHEKDTDWRE